MRGPPEYVALATLWLLASAFVCECVSKDASPGFLRLVPTGGALVSLPLVDAGTAMAVDWMFGRGWSRPDCRVDPEPGGTSQFKEILDILLDSSRSRHHGVLPDGGLSRCDDDSCGHPQLHSIPEHGFLGTRGGRRQFG